MAAWSALEAWTGFGFSAVDKVIRFKARAGRYPWSNGHAWGTVGLRQTNAGAWKATLETLGGRNSARRLALEGVGEAKLSAAKKQTVTIPSPI
jgi:hypothetical protein